MSGAGAGDKRCTQKGLGVAEFSQVEPLEAAPLASKQEPPMDIHKPKPVHSLRELLGEIGVIVIGVVIALGAEQLVENLNWRHEVSEARELLGDELSQSMARSIERVRLEDCLENRLDKLSNIIDQASRTGALPPTALAGNPPVTEWPSEVWRSVIASQTATHFSSETLSAIGLAYTKIEDLKTANNAELLVWTRLNTLSGPGRRFDPASEADLRAALSEARIYNRVMALQGGQLVDTIQTLHLPVSGEAQKVIDSAVQFDIAVHPACQALGTDIPSAYGQAPFGGAYREQIKELQRHPPYARGAL